MQIEGLNFLKVRKFLRAKSMKKKKISDENKEIRVDFQTTKYLVLLWFWERKCPPYDQRWRIKYGCIEQ